MNLKLSLSCSLFLYWINITRYNLCLFGMKFISCLFHTNFKNYDKVRVTRLTNSVQKLCLFGFFEYWMESLASKWRLSVQCLLNMFIYTSGYWDIPRRYQKGGRPIRNTSWCVPWKLHFIFFAWLGRNLLTFLFLEASLTTMAAVTSDFYTVG